MKKMMILTVLLIVATASFAQLFGGEKENEKDVKGLGLHFGTLSANGFSYRRIVGKNGVQFTLGAITLGSNSHYFDSSTYLDDAYSPTVVLTEDGRRTNINFGVNYLYTLANNRTGRFYTMAGAALLYSRVKEFQLTYTQDNSGSHYYHAVFGSEQTAWKDKGYYYVGGGLGFDFKLGQNFHWVVELPLTMNQDLDFMMYIPQSGLYYYF